MSSVGILVHGTFAGPKPGVTQWYQRTRDDPESFFARLDSALIARGKGPPNEWEVSTWSGGNTHGDRIKGAEDLFELLQRLLSDSAEGELVVIAHSHGGNVVLKALELLWRHNREAEGVFRQLLLNFAKYGTTGMRDHVRELADTWSRTKGISDELRSFVINVQLPIGMVARLTGGSPPNDDLAREQWADERLHSRSMRSLLEAFCTRWSVERRPRIHLVTMGTPFFEKAWRSP